MDIRHEIKARAPGKFIISGEYSVVFGKPAIAAAIDAKTTVTVRISSSNSVKLRLNDLGCTIIWDLSVLKKTRLLKGKNQQLIYQDDMIDVIERDIYQNSQIEYDESNKPDDLDKKIRDSSIAFLLIYLCMGDSFGSHDRLALEINVESDIPVGSGLGSSSAYSVSLIGALNRLYKEPMNLPRINQWAFNTDKFFHGKPSGVDNSVISHGGYILFRAGEIIAQAKQNPSIQVMLIDTLVSRSTKTMGLILKAEREMDSNRTDRIFENISEVTNKIWNCMNSTDDDSFDPREIEDLLSINHSLLEDLGVGHEKLTNIKELAKKHGFVAKMSGAGCGGGAFILYRPDKDSEKIKMLQYELEQAGYKVRLCLIGCGGLTVTNDGQ